MPALNVCVQIYMNKKTHKVFKKYNYLSSFQKLCQCMTKLLKRREIFVLFINFVCFFLFM